MLVAKNGIPTPTAFQYVAHVPPMAIGPQFAGRLGQDTLPPASGLSPATISLLTFAGALVLGIPLAYFAIRRFT